MKILSKIKPINGADFKIADAKDIAIGNSDVEEKISSIDKSIKNSASNIYVENFEKLATEQDDTGRLQRAIDYATANKLKLTCKGSNNFIISKTLNITKAFNVDFNKATIVANCETAININIANSTETQSILENLNLDCKDVKKGITVNARRIYLRNNFLFNINSIGIDLSGGYEISLSYCNFKGIGKTNKAIVLNTTDNYINNCFGTDNNIFIENNADGNIISSCHAWIYNKDILQNSIFIVLNNSALVEKCVSDTYSIAFQCKTNGTSRIVNNNCIVEPTVYNKNNITEPPIFINFVGDIPVYRTNISNNWINFPSTDKTNFDIVGKFTNIDTINILGAVNGNTGNLDFLNEVKVILTNEATNISNTQSYVVRKNNRASLKCYFAFKDTVPTSETVIFKLPNYMRPYKNMYTFGVQGTNIDNLSKPVYGFIKSTGEVVIKNCTGDTTMSQGLLQCEFDVWQPGIDS